MVKILVLGAGFVTGPLVAYLHSRNYQIIIGSQFLHEAEALAGDKQGVTPISVDVTDKKKLSQLIKQVDLVISFVPFQCHVSVAKACIEKKTPMVTASYAHGDMRSLNQAALSAGIIVLNEVGVDPGIDHMTAMQVIDEAHRQGNQVEAFVSWCGGLPAPSANNNPLGYKFSWSPMAVLSAVSNDAQYLSSGELKKVDARNLLTSMRDIDFSPGLTLQGYPNRDSTGYRFEYGIPEVNTLLRGTLRYPGFGKIMNKAKRVGLLSETSFLEEQQPQTWLALMASLTGVPPADLPEDFDSDQSIIDGFAWLGCFSDEPVVGRTPINAFCDLLSNKLKYEDDEQDMIVMQHRFVLVDAEGRKTLRRSTMIEQGDIGGFSAMAKTVGFPAAIAADLILSGKITRKGVCIPVTEDLYAPILAELARLDIAMKEEIVTDQDEEHFLNGM